MSLLILKIFQFDYLKWDFIHGLLKVVAKWTLENMKRLVLELDNISCVICGWQREGRAQQTGEFSHAGAPKWPY